MLRGNVRFIILEKSDTIKTFKCVELLLRTTIQAGYKTKSKYDLLKMVKTSVNCKNGF